MSSGARIGLVLATVVALVVAFVALSPGDNGDGESTTASTPTTTAPAAAGEVPTTTGDERPTAQLPPKPTFTTIRVRGGQPSGGVKTIRVKKGDRARIQVSSPDTTDEVHLHGYDVSRDLTAGGRVRFSFDANAEGIFDIELEGSHTLIGKLEVRPS